MRILIDDGAFPRYAPLLEARGHTVFTIHQLFGDGIEDPDWLDAAVTHDFELVITADKQISGRPREAESFAGFLRNGGFVIFLKPGVFRLTERDRSHLLRSNLDAICVRCAEREPGEFGQLDEQLILRLRPYSSPGA